MNKGLNTDTKQKSGKEKDIVFPSEYIAVEEEFLPAKGTYVENNEIRSSLFGEVSVDKKYYKARVYPIVNPKPFPKFRDEVIAQVTIVNRSSLKLNVVYHAGREVTPPYSAIMHISDASREYLKSLEDVYGRGDFIRAVVNDSKSFPLQLECKRAENGVIYTLCDKCGDEVEKVKRNTLKCNTCGWTQNRLTAIDYGKVKL